MTVGPALRIDVSSLLQATGAVLDVDTDVPLESLAHGEAVLEFAERPRLKVTIADLGDVLSVTGSVEASATVECVRCLEPFVLTLHGTIEAAVAVTAEAPIDEASEWYPLVGDSVDLLPAAEGALRMEVPFAPIHDETCRGICPTCGCDLNRDACGCEPRHETAGESPFSALKDAFPLSDR